MFKKLLLALVVALPFGAMAQKFGVVDINTVFAGMPEAAAMQKELQDLSKQYEDELQKLQEQVNKLYTEYQTIQEDQYCPVDKRPPYAGNPRSNAES